jgi:hypothetical protein
VLWIVLKQGAVDSLPYAGMIRTGSKGFSQQAQSTRTPSNSDWQSTPLPIRVNLFVIPLSDFVQVAIYNTIYRGTIRPY